MVQPLKMYLKEQFSLAADWKQLTHDACEDKDTTAQKKSWPN